MEDGGWEERRREALQPMGGGNPAESAGTRKPATPEFLFSKCVLSISLSLSLSLSSINPVFILTPFIHCACPSHLISLSSITLSLPSSIIIISSLPSFPF